MSQEPLDSRSPPSEIATIAEYPPVSRLAVISLLLAIAAIGAVFNPLMICVAAAGGTLAAIALWSIARTEPPPLGRKAAFVALLLSLFCGAWGLTWRIARQQIVCHEAQRLADKWLQMVREGRLQEAHQLHLPWKDRQAPGTNLVDYYRKELDSPLGMDDFFRREPLRRIVDAGSQGRLRFLRCENVQDRFNSESTTHVATLRYALDYSRHGRPETLTFLAIVAGTIERQAAEAHWELREVQAPSGRR